MATIIGFEWRLAPAIATEMFVAGLMQAQGAGVAMGRTERCLVLHDTSERLYGLIATRRDHKNRTLLVNHGDRWATNIEQFDRDRRPVEFNYFVLIKSSKRGLYFTNRHACSLWSFCHFVKRLHDGQLAGAKAGIIGEYAGSPSRALRFRLNRECRKFGWAYRCSRKPWQALVQRSRYIQSVTYKALRPDAEAEYGVPVNDLLLRETTTLTFNRRLRAGGAISDLIFRIMVRENPAEVVARVDRGDGRLERIHLAAQNVEDCGVFDPDELSRLAIMDNLFTDFGASPLIERLDQAVQANAVWLTPQSFGIDWPAEAEPTDAAPDEVTGSGRKRVFA